MSSRRVTQEETRASRSPRRPERGRQERQRSRSVGATTVAATQARAIGLANPETRRHYGRGETARRVEEERSRSYEARPAVYTHDARAQTHAHTLEGFPFAIPLIVLGVLVVSFFMLSGPVRMYYAAWRDSELTQVEYDAVVQQNLELKDELERLQTLDGIEDEARRRGYAYPDEEALIVDNLVEEKVADPAKVEEAIREYEESLPWYIGILDTVLGYAGTDS